MPVVDLIPTHGSLVIGHNTRRPQSTWGTFHVYQRRQRRLTRLAHQKEVHESQEHEISLLMLVDPSKKYMKAKCMQ
jgi:hypothetical protein